MSDRANRQIKAPQYLSEYELGTKVHSNDKEVLEEHSQELNGVKGEILVLQIIPLLHDDASKNDLKLHIASVHEGNKPFKCELCDHSFSRKDVLNRHVESVQKGIKPRVT